MATLQKPVKAGLFADVRYYFWAAYWGKYTSAWTCRRGA